MFAILIAPENMPKIAERFDLPPHDQNFIDMCLRDRSDWYFISGYVTERGQVTDWSVLPRYRLFWSFDFDEEKIKTDWTITVRKD